jgi:integrase
MKRVVEVKAEPMHINQRPAFAGDDFNLFVHEAERWVAEAAEMKDTVRWRRQALLDWVMVARWTGLRPPHELEALCWRHIQWDTQCILVPAETKTGKRTVPFLDGGQTLARLQAMLNRRKDYAREHFTPFSMDEPVFAMPDGAPILDFHDGFNAVIKRCAFPPRGDQMPYSPYSLRHTFATDLLANGWTYEALAKVMGNSVKILQEHYDQVTIAMIRQYYERRQSGGNGNGMVKDFGEPLVLADPSGYGKKSLVIG